MLRKRYILVASFLIMSLLSFGQSFQIGSSIDSTVIYIGQQCNLTFRVNKPEGKHVVLPKINDTIVSGIEVVERSLDTAKLPDGTIEIRQNFVITSFDSALYYIPEFSFVEGGDTLWSNSMSLKVLTVPIDTVSEEMPIADIKPAIDPPFDWKRFLMILGIVLLALALVGIAIWRYIVYRRNRKKVVVEEKVVEIKKTPQEIALEKLEQIRIEKIWQQGRVKEYYTQLTDVLREYLEGRFGVVAFERTSSEIIDSLAFARKDYPEQIVLLQRILSTSDMVKFAKLIPDFSTHTDVITESVRFVEETKEVVKAEPKVEPRVEPKDKEAER